MIRQVFTNLISNALKYRRAETPPQIRVHGETMPDDVRFHVEDNGIGIKADQLDRIFEIFRRLHTRNEFEGTGIGLASSEKIVRLHGGRIWVNSVPGNGSVFSFSIPRGTPNGR